MTVSPSTTETEAPEDLVPDPGSFDLEAFIADRATFARYKITLHLAAEEAHESNRLKDRLDSLHGERDALQRQTKNAKTPVSLGESAPEVVRLAELDKTIRELQAQRAELKKRIAASALTFHFSVTGREVQRRVQERIRAMLTDAEGSVEDRLNDRFGRDPEEITRQTAAMMFELTTQVVNASGNVLPKDKITEASLVGLLNVIPLAELTRVNETLALAMNSAQDFDRALDAGFPG